jgi:hypothetical protein
LAVAILGLAFPPASAQAQQVSGRVLDQAAGVAIPVAAVFVLDSAQAQVASTLVDSIGRFRVVFPRVGRYYLAAESFGYVRMISPPIELPAETSVEFDLELAPDPIALDPLAVSVRNEEMEQWLTLRGQEGNPSAKFGFRLIQGGRITEARGRARDNTDFFRWLYIPISHGRQVCITVQRECAEVYLDDRWIPAEQIESYDFANIIAIVAVPIDDGPNELHLFTTAFDFRGGGR